MPRYMADVVDQIHWAVEFDAPEGLSDEEIRTRALDAWASEDDRVSALLRYDKQEVATILKLPD